MATQVRETKAGSSISAYVVMNKKGVHVATVNAHFSDGGTVTVDVWNHGAAVTACFETADKLGLVSQASRKSRDTSEWSLFGLQQGRASGYGYDKFAAALSGLWVDGQQMADHCGTVANTEKAKAALFKAYNKAKDASSEHDEKAWTKWHEKAKKLGARFRNYSQDSKRYQSLHFITGLERLEDLGYTVIQAI